MDIFSCMVPLVSRTCRLSVYPVPLLETVHWVLTNSEQICHDGDRQDSLTADTNCFSALLRQLSSLRREQNNFWDLNDARICQTACERWQAYIYRQSSVGTEKRMRWEEKLQTRCEQMVSYSGQRWKLWKQTELWQQLLQATHKCGLTDTSSWVHKCLDSSVFF